MNEIGLANITFPVYRIGVEKPSFDKGIAYYVLGKDTEYEDAQYQILVLDDKNIPHESLALRRLHLKKQGVKLYSISKAIFFISDLIKMAKARTWFITSTGEVFQYKKTLRVKLKYLPISKVMPMQNGGAIIEVKGLEQRFKTLFMPYPWQKYAGVLEYNRSIILYGLYDQEYKESYRLI